jgi:hypothetical protein
MNIYVQSLNYAIFYVNKKLKSREPPSQKKIRNQAREIIVT